MLSTLTGWSLWWVPWDALVQKPPVCIAPRAGRPTSRRADPPLPPAWAGRATFSPPAYLRLNNWRRQFWGSTQSSRFESGINMGSWVSGRLEIELVERVPGGLLGSAWQLSLLASARPSTSGMSPPSQILPAVYQEHLRESVLEGSRM